jgi:multisubunit Na+/H+ antiporter MnhG subunit
MQYVHLGAEIFGWIMLASCISSMGALALLRARDQYREGGNIDG